MTELGHYPTPTDARARREPDGRLTRPASAPSTTEQYQNHTNCNGSYRHPRDQTNPSAHAFDEHPALVTTANRGIGRKSTRQLAALRREGLGSCSTLPCLSSYGQASARTPNACRLTSSASFDGLDFGRRDLCSNAAAGPSVRLRRRIS